jgi:hypothetical protein
MKILKYISLALLLVIFILFLMFGVEYKAGHYYPEGKECVIPTGQAEVYVHWLLPLNNTVSNFCDGSMTPKYYEAKGGCNCVD